MLLATLEVVLLIIMLKVYSQRHKNLLQNKNTETRILCFYSREVYYELANQTMAFLVILNHMQQTLL